MLMGKSNVRQQVQIPWKRIALVGELLSEFLGWGKMMERLSCCANAKYSGGELL